MSARRTSLDDLTRRAAVYFNRRAASFGLRRGAVQAHYILNWGGFVNASFLITDGQAKYHLKLACEPEDQDRLARWRAFAPRLEAEYHAPRLIDWFSVPGTEYAGLLFEYLDARPLDPSAQPAVTAAVLALLDRLHGDPALKAALLAEDDVETCADAFIGVYVDRFDEDLLTVAGDLPPFVPLPLLDWMMGETRELEGLARDLPAFQHPAASPTHGDLWSNNILVGAGGFHIIDWDDLALGDPAIDYSILLSQGGGAVSDAALPGEDRFPGLRERFAVYRRAFLLDQVIDNLADWVEAGYAPEHAGPLRAAKEAAHRQALAAYREQYGNS